MSTRLERINARHPWSHNDHFHPWILANLPAQRRAALDVGCGQGELLAALAPHFETVHGSDLDATMRQRAQQRCSGLSNVTVDDAPRGAVPGSFDVVTMVAVLHHLDVADALRDVRRLLAPGGRFLAVGLAPPQSAVDHLWDLASALTNPVIGYVKHPWPSSSGVQTPAYPTVEPAMPYAAVRDLVTTIMPGAQMHHRLGFRHTITWTKPR